MHELFFCADASVQISKRISPTSAQTNTRGATKPAANLLDCATATLSADRSCRFVGLSRFMNLFRQIPYDCHHHNEQQREHAQQVKDNSAPEIVGRTVDKRHDEQEHRDDIECHDADYFAVHPQYFRGQPLERLEHEEEVPLRLDARWRR